MTKAYEVQKRWKAKHPSDHKEYQRQYRGRFKDRVIQGYGARCKCCGEATRVFLTLDHVNGGGLAHRGKRTRSNIAAYRDANRRNFPPDYQVLCFNCNVAKHMLGVCPHQVIDE